MVEVDGYLAPDFIVNLGSNLPFLIIWLEKNLPLLAKDLKEKSFEDEVFLSHAVVCLSAVFIEDHIADNFEISWLTLSVNIKHKILTYLRTRVDEERQFLARRANKNGGSKN